MGLGGIWFVRRLLTFAERIRVFRYFMRLLRTSFAVLVAVLVAFVCCALIVEGARSVGGIGWAFAAFCLLPIWAAYRISRRVLRDIWRGEYDLFKVMP